MKKNGCIMEFTKEREAEIMNAYRRMARQHSVINVTVCSKEIAKQPASRFWVSEERAASVVSALDRGLPVLERMHPSKRRMFQEIYSRVMQERQRHPGQSLVSTISSVIYNPAPEHYMAPKSIKEMIYLALASARQNYSSKWT